MSSADIYLIIYISGFIILTICFAALAIALVKTFNAIMGAFRSLEKQIDNLGNEPSKLIHQANDLSESLNHNMKCLDPLFRTLQYVGEQTAQRAERHKEERLMEYLSERFQERKESRTDQVIEITDLVLRSLDLFYKLKRRK